MQNLHNLSIDEKRFNFLEKKPACNGAGCVGASLRTSQ
ncbi:MAG: hypothetical protein RIS60_2288 [Pseudomonadota bacterium]|jgi:hypothetical protein